MCSLYLAETLDQANEGELAGAVNGYEQGQFALFGADLCDVDVEVADRILGKSLLLKLVGFDLRHTADAVPLQAPVQAGAGQMREGRLQAVEAVVQRQQRMPPKGDDDRPSSGVRTVERGSFGPMAASTVVSRSRHF